MVVLYPEPDKSLTACKIHPDDANNWKSFLAEKKCDEEDITFSLVKDVQWENVGKLKYLVDGKLVTRT